MERRHPVLGVVGGACVGLGVALLLFVYGAVPMTVLWLAVIVLGSALVGWIIARWTPAREPSDEDAGHSEPLATASDQPAAKESE